MKNTILSLNHVSYTYHTMSGETKALKDLSFNVYEGEFLSVVGPSGCGKSTLLSLISGLLKPDIGQITFYGKNQGYMLQKDHLFPWLSIYENITLGLKIHHISDHTYIQKINSLIEKFELEDFKYKYPGELSGGMRQRAALIRSLALNPDLILLDEPFSALDYQTRQNVSSDIGNQIRNEHKTAILITHDLAEALNLSDRILVLTKRPASVCLNLNISDIPRNNAPGTLPNSPVYHQFFHQIWEALQNENTEIT